MPRRTKSAPRVFRNTRSVIRSKPHAAGHKCFWVSMTALTESKPYMENFYKRHRRCQFVEYYIVPHADTATYDIIGYIQLQYPTLIQELINYFNCRTTIKSTTIAEKLDSDFHNNNTYNKISIGTERASLRRSLWAIDYNRQNLKSNDLHIDIAQDYAMQPAI